MLIRQLGRDDSLILERGVLEIGFALRIPVMGVFGDHQVLQNRVVVRADESCEALDQRQGHVPSTVLRQTMNGAVVCGSDSWRVKCIKVPRECEACLQIDLPETKCCAARWAAHLGHRLEVNQRRPACCFPRHLQVLKLPTQLPLGRAPTGLG